MLTVLTALAVAAVGCSGGGSSSSSGGSSAQMSKVQGNVSSANLASAIETQAAGNELLLSVLNQAVSPAQAAVNGIEVCIAGICTTTDDDGFFTLDISGIDAGLYGLTFQVGGVIYTLPLSEEISSTSVVIINDVTILGNDVTAGEILYQDGDLGGVSGGVTSAPDDTGNGDDGDGQPQVVICHKPDTSAEQTKTVSEPAVPAHLGHGDYQGACIAGDDEEDDEIIDDGEVIDDGDDVPEEG